MVTRGVQQQRTERRPMQPSTPRGRLVSACAVLALVLFVFSGVTSCSSRPWSQSPAVGTPDTSQGGGSSGPSGPGPTGVTVRVVGVGDIGMCGSPGVAQVSRLVAGLDGQILLAGDIAYLHGSAANFRDCFEPQWGR